MSNERAFDETLATSPGEQEPRVSTGESAGASASFAPGDVLAGRYVVERALGAGAMGEVYRVRDRQLDEVVALKRLTLPGGGDAADRFLREVKLGRRVTHRNVARTHDVGEHAGTLFLTMELIEGRTLEDVLEARGGAMPPVEAAALCAQVLDGLAAAHEANIVHRDLKPANVIVAGDGRVVLTDFGIARAAAEPGLTRAQQLLGTPLYMAPEQVRGMPVDHRADLYAFGVLFFELLTGQWPFDGETAVEMALARVANEPKDPRIFGVEERYAEVIERCLAREPEARPSSAREVLDLLRGTASGPKTSPKPVAPLAHGVESLAVLPFSYRGPADEDYLGAGIAEELVDVLGRLRGIRVLAFSTTSPLGPGAAPADVVARFGVAHLVAGSVQLRGKELRITARLVDADGTQRWSERFAGVVEDLFELQESVSRRIAEALRLELDVVSDGKVPQEAVEHYFRARRHFLRDGYAEVDGPLEALERCIALAPRFRPAYALHAAASARSWFTASLLATHAQAAELAQRSVERALQAAPNHPETHLAVGILALQRLDHAASAAAFVRALEIAPTLPLAQVYLASVQIELGDYDEAERRLEVAAELDPSVGTLAYVSLARIAFFRRDWLAYERYLERTGSLRDGGPRFYLELRAALWSGDRTKLEPILRAAGGKTGRPHLDVIVRYVTGEVDREPAVESLLASLAQIDNPRFRQLARQLAVEAAMTLGDVEAAARLVEVLGVEPFIDVDWLDRCPILEQLRATDAFRQVRSQVLLKTRDVLSRSLVATRTWSS